MNRICTIFVIVALLAMVVAACAPAQPTVDTSALEKADAAVATAQAEAAAAQAAAATAQAQAAEAVDASAGELATAQAVAEAAMQEAEAAKAAAEAAMQEAAEPAEEEAAPAPTPKPKSSGPTTIRIITFAQGFAWPELFGEDGVTESDRLKEFEAQENVDIAVEWGDETAVRQKVAADLASRTGRFCVVLVGSDGGVQTYGAGGLLEPLDDYFTNYPQDYLELDDIYTNFLDANRMDGKLYALPYYSFGPGMIYRTDLFEKYGLEPPTTIDELYEVLEALKQGLEADGIDDVYPVTMRGAPGEEPSLDLLGFVYAYAGYPAWFEGGPVTAEEIKATSAQPIFTSDDFAKGFSAFADILQKYGPPGAATHTWVDMMNIYMQGNAAILMPSAINGYASLTFGDNETVLNNSAFAPSPAGPSGEVIQSFWTFSLGINADCEDKEAAWKVLTFLTGKESQQAFADRVGWPTVTMKSVMHSDSLVDRWGEEEINANEEAILESNPFYFPYIPELVEYMDRIGTSVSSVIAGEQTSEEALNQLQSWATERMLRAGYYR